MGTEYRGFASMDKEKQRGIASKGGKASHATGKAHKFTPEEAREAGKKGGRLISANREHMAAIGRKGGLASTKKTHVASAVPAGLENPSDPFPFSEGT